MAKRSGWSAILAHKCPRCREGDIFEYSIWERPTQFIKTHKNCPHCDLAFEREPGFFFGAMYVSYALTMAIFLGSTFVLYYFFGDPSTLTYILTVVGAVLLLTPIVFRYSRTLYLHGFGGVKYDEAYSE